MITAAQIRDDPSRFTKLRLVEPKAGVPFRFGGPPPKGIQPRRLTPLTAFLLTLPFEERLSCSIFINLTSFDSTSPHFVFTAAGIVHDETSHLIEACWHDVDTGGGASALPVVLPVLNFELAGEGRDPLSGEGKMPDPGHCFDHHKLGGFPYFYQAGDEVVDTAQRLIAEGFYHHFQLAFPGPGDADINCDWPFGEYVFHVFAKPANGRWELRFVWS